jgi:hypothetical protein
MEERMAKITQIQLWSRERDEHGFPKKYNLYQIGPTQRIGDTYTSPVLRVRDNDYRIGSLASRVKASTEDEARAKAIDHFRQEATKMTLDFLVVELPEV